MPQQRNEVLSNIPSEETVIHRDLIREVRAQRKAFSTGQFTAREVLEPRMNSLPSGMQDALNAVIVRDEIGLMPGEQPPALEIKLAGSKDRVRLSSFGENRPVQLVLGSYT